MLLKYELKLWIACVLHQNWADIDNNLAIEVDPKTPLAANQGYGLLQGFGVAFAGLDWHKISTTAKWVWTERPKRTPIKITHILY